FSEATKSSKRMRISGTTYPSTNTFTVTMGAVVAPRARRAGPDSSPTSSTSYSQQERWERLAGRTPLAPQRGELLIPRPRPRLSFQALTEPRYHSQTSADVHRANSQRGLPCH